MRQATLALITAAMLSATGAAKSRKHPNSAQFNQTAAACEKSISFGIAGPGGVVPGVPKFAWKWARKNASKYPGLCFSQSANPNAQNFLLVFSASRSAFNGFYPTVRTTTSTDTTPVSGSGTLTDEYGGTWDYTYEGTATNTTTTTTRENVPYTDTAHTVYLYAYDQRGKVVSGRWRTISTREGGDAANTLGYNLGALLRASIDTRGRLLKAVVIDVYGNNEAYANLPAAASAQGATGVANAPAHQESTNTQCATGQHWIATSYGGYCGAAGAASATAASGAQGTTNAQCATGQHWIATSYGGYCGAGGAASADGASRAQGTTSTQCAAGHHWIATSYGGYCGPGGPASANGASRAQGTTHSDIPQRSVPTGAGSGASASDAGVYAGVGPDHWISSKDNDGAVIVLEDGSIWEINAVDRVDTALWLPITNIVVLCAKQPIGDYKYKLIDTDDDETALARYLGAK